MPLPLPLPARRPLLGCGAELESVRAASPGRAPGWGHHIGDLQNWETLRSFRSGIEHLARLRRRPEVVAHDLHPDYLSTRHAQELEGVELAAVQHHHAHLAACLAEHGETGPAIGAIFDGSGYGPDGTVWGASCWPATSAATSASGCSIRWLPGGDRAAREP